MNLVTKCAISGKNIKESDDVIAFPLFYFRLGEPEAICCENIALRSEFEQWYLKDSVIQRVRDFWVQLSREKRYLLILAESENFLIVKSTIESRISLYFLRHVFSIRFKEAEWKNFEELMLTSEQGAMNVMGDDGLFWNVESAKDNVTIQTRNVWKDTIVIPLAEWRSLQELLSANK